MEEKLISLVGAPSTTVRRIKDKQTRLEIGRLIGACAGNPKVLLRGYLSIGRTPPAQLVAKDNIVGSLSAGDCAAFLPLLVQKTVVLEPAFALESLSELLSRSPAGDSHEILRSLVRAIGKWPTKKKNEASEVSQKACPYFLCVVNSLLTTQSRTATETPKKKKRGAPTRALLTLVKHGITWAGDVADHRTTLLAIRMVVSVERRLRIDIQDLLAEDDEFSKSFDMLCQRSLERLDMLAGEGAISDFEEWARVLLDLPAKKKEAQVKLESLFLQRGRFHEGIQQALANVLGLPQEAKPAPEIRLDVADRLETTQLGSALLRAWAAKDEGAKANEVFVELGLVLKNFFGIELRGNAGDAGTYNPRLHELAQGERPTPRVRLVHPWVECSSGPTVRVLIKALVKGET